MDMRVTYVARSFLDYRVPVLNELNDILGGRLTFVYSAAYVPERAQKKLKAALGPGAVGMTGEVALGPEDNDGLANRSLSIRIQPGLLRAISESRPDVLVGDGFFKWTFGALLHSVMHRTPLVICYERTFHTERNAQWFRTLFRRAVIGLTSAMCCNGRLCGEYVRSLGMPEDRITYGHMVADSDGLAQQVSETSDQERAELRKRLGVSRVEPMILYVGSLTVRKGVRELLRGWRVFEDRGNRGASLVLVGKGQLEGELQEFCEAERVRNVRIVGAIDYDLIGKYYAAADAVIMPTLEDNWSLVVPEAMACGLPVACSKYNGGWPELIQEEENGWIFDPLDEVATCTMLERVSASAERLGAMGAAAKAIAAAYTPKTAAKAIYRACEIAVVRRKWSR